MGLFDFGLKKTSSSYAKDRLRYLLVSDKTDCSKETLEQIKSEIICVVSKYFDTDISNTLLTVKQNSIETEDKQSVLYIQIPIRNLNVKTMK